MMTPVTDLTHNTAIVIIGAQDLPSLDNLISNNNGCWVWRPTAPIVEHIDAAGNVGDDIYELSDEANAALKRISSSNPAEDLAAVIRREVSAQIAETRRDLVASATNTPQYGRKAKKKKNRDAGGTKKTEIIRQLLVRPEGCTTAEILSVTDWPSVSVPQQAKALCLEIRKEKIDGVTRYFGTEIPKS